MHISKMFYARFENSQIEHIVEMVERLRKQRNHFVSSVPSNRNFNVISDSDSGYKKHPHQQDLAWIFD